MSLARIPELSLEEMQALARKLGNILRAGDVVCLEGEVGAGKTSFAQALIGAIAPGAPEVTSPTYVLMQSYDVETQDGPCQLWHLDLYRLEEESEVAALGLEELDGAILLIEWPRIAFHVLSEARLELVFGFEGEKRNLEFSGNDAWRERLAGLM